MTVGRFLAFARLRWTNVEVDNVAVGVVVGMVASAVMIRAGCCS